MKDELFYPGIFATVALLIMLFVACSGCGMPGLQTKAMNASFACVRSAIESALAACETEECKAGVRAENAAECAHFPDLCSETVVAGPQP